MTSGAVDQKRHLTRQEARQSMQELMANVGSEGWFLMPPASARKVNDLCELVAEDGFDAVKDKKLRCVRQGCSALNTKSKQLMRFRKPSSLRAAAWRAVSGKASELENLQHCLELA